MMLVWAASSTISYQPDIWDLPMPGKVRCPFIIAVDTREQAPYRFADIAVDRRDAVYDVTTVRQTLGEGDYQLDSRPDWIAIERKSMADLFGTLGQRRACFAREMERLAKYRRAAVVVEAELSTVLRAPPPRSRLRPKVISRTAQSWWVRYGIPWFFLPGRVAAERFVFRTLWQAHRHFEDSQ